MTVHVGDCLNVLPTLDDNSIDAIVTDPPYAIGIQGHKWDTMQPAEFQTWCTRWAAECLRVLKPGGYMLAFGATRTCHRLAAGVEDAGFTIRDLIAWLYTSGYPASFDLTDAVEAFQAGEPEDDRAREEVLTITGWLRNARDRAGWTNRQIDELFGTSGMAGHWTTPGSQPAVPRLDQWDQLKTAMGFDDSRIRDLVEQHAATRTWTAGGGRARTEWFPGLHDGGSADGQTGQTWGTRLKPSLEPIVLAQKPPAGSRTQTVRRYGTGALHLESEGRWPSNVTVLDGTPVLGLADPAEFWPAFRFGSKAGPDERPTVGGVQHSTVKPLDYIRWLVDLITPPGGVVLDPFAGSGTTGVACIAEGRDYVLIEREPEHAAIIAHRLNQPIQQALI